MNEVEKKLWHKVMKFVPLLRFIPGVRMVAVCNNLAFGKVHKNSDIDLFIIIKKGRLFSARFFITLLLHILAVRRHGNKISGRFCLSFFIDDSHLSLRSIAFENDVYLAYWISTLVPVVDDGVYYEFLNENKWIYHLVELPVNIKSVRKFTPFSLFWIPDFFENFMREWQIKRAGRKLLNASDESELIVNEHILKFHNIDRRKQYRDLWLNKYGNAKVTAEKFTTLQV